MASREELLSELRRVADELSETPTATQFNENSDYWVSNYQSEFGSWNEALESADLVLNQNRATNADVSDFVDDILRVKEIVDRVPRRDDMDEYGNWNPTTYQQRLPDNDEKSRWSAVLRQADLEPHWEIRDTRETECEVCGDSFVLKEYEKDRRFCSRECHGKWREGRFTGDDHWSYSEVEVECAVCENTFKRVRYFVEQRENHFCDHDCYGQWLSENNTGEDHPRWNGETVYGEGWNEEKRERVRERDNRRCQACGKPETDELEQRGRKLSVHHIIPASEFDDPQKRNAIDNLVSLCVEHHNIWEGIPLRPTIIK